MTINNYSLSSDSQLPTSIKILPGKPYPLGATWDGKGVNFALFSENAKAVDLCLFENPAPGAKETRFTVPEQTAHVWHCYIPGIMPGQAYGWRVYGLYEPYLGQRFNPNKLLLDPYAKTISGQISWNDAVLGFVPGTDAMDTRDSAPYVPKAIVIDPTFDWGDDKRPETPLHRSVIYEMHVKGFTAVHPLIDPAVRGTYAGLATPPALDYFKKLGITAVELLPIHHFINDNFLVEKSLSNYWGYQTLGYLAPHGEYSSSGKLGQQVVEFKQMVKALHAAGIEVILDVVYNHTGEGNHLGPTVCFRGIDNQAYYRINPFDQRMYVDYTGTGNTLNTLHPRVLQLLMDSLRYWITEMHVDGFRFDLASTLAREGHHVSRLSSFFDVIQQDPLISQVKLIAEPWDIGEGGYQVGNFPVLWSEWNGKYRDNVRKFWKGDENEADELAFRLTGSSDLYQNDGRKPYASINFITAHDGFTLHDLVSYNEKHNLANGENNLDGESHNSSWNCGAEGDTTNPEIIELRERQKRNFLATLFFSQGVPMLLGGDEFGRTQRGNNNAYCQDNPISWFNWYWDERGTKLFEFVCKLIRLRKENPLLHRRKFFIGKKVLGSDLHDIMWLQPDGAEMDMEDWHNGHTRCIGMFLNGEAMTELDEDGNQIQSDILLVLLNAWWGGLDFRLPELSPQFDYWEVLADTFYPDLPPNIYAPEGRSYHLEPRSLVLLQAKRRNNG
jgi:isoamylase